MDSLTQKKMLIRSLRGAPWTVVMAMVMLPSLHGEVEIAGATGYSRKTIRQALIDLEALGFVNRNGRFEAWILTARARQMVLGEGVDPDPEALTVDADVVEPDVPEPDAGDCDAGSRGKNYPSKGKNYPSPSSSSLTPHVSTDITDITTNNYNSDGEGEKLPLALDGDAELALKALQARGVRRKQARDAVEAALRSGWSGLEVRDAVDGWLAYAGTARGKTIKHAGYLTAARIRDHELPPEPDAPSETDSREDLARAYIEAAYDRMVNR